MKRYAPGWEKTRDQLVSVLDKALHAPGTVLEIGSGTGQKSAYIAAKLPSITWIPSEVDPGLVESIAAWRAEAALPNLRAPRLVDAASEEWDVVPALTAIIAVEFVAAAPWPAVVGLVRGAARLLPPGGDLLISGRFADADLLRVAKSRGLEPAASHDLDDGARLLVLRSRV